jgi:UDP-glucose 4-epimerase
VYLTLFIQTSAALEDTIVITGGAGYIGSATTLYMLHKGYNVVVIDRKFPESTYFSQSKKIEPTMNAGDSMSALRFDATRELPEKVIFIKADFADKEVLEKVFSSFRIGAVIHFAGFLEVNKSVKDPEPFYQNNVEKTLQLLAMMRHHKINKFIFSSSASVYGTPSKPNLLVESAQRIPINPYGNTKFMIEIILEDYAKAYQLQAVSLRYFNAAGALPEYDIGERHDPETHVIPLLLRAAYESKPFFIFGQDYKTRDNTCIRDYLHIYDLADAHYLALQYLNKGYGSFEAFNLGVGNGSTVKELIACAEKTTGRQINTQIAPRRAGDPDWLIADSTKAQELLGWHPTNSSLDNIMLTAHQFHSKNQKPN